ncbi:MAG: crossover junction endodeoxyribonuclease RuvC [Rhodospirillales bacterium]|jgi:crossover junction endodeoxyribonuclease RuvC|nr:crossover junction endodeoxyribonuclease RuvC [Rhodospirillales bacterium]
MRILGLDPGLRATGWGIIETDGNRLRHVGNGDVATDGRRTLAERLVQLFEGLADLIARYQPVEAAIEETFVNMNPASTLKLGQARGVGMLAAAHGGLRVVEYSPRLVKKTIVGTGKAAKVQVEAMVRTLLPGCAVAGSDAADALAVAICHAHHRPPARDRVGWGGDASAAEGRS